MALEESVGCDGSCSSLDPIGCKLLSHDEVERQLDEGLRQLEESLKPSLSERYTQFMSNVQQNYPTTYKVLRLLRF